MPRQYSSISGHLTPTPPRQEDMRLDSTLNVTLEGSLGDLPAVVGGMEEAKEGTHQVSEETTRGPSTNVKTSMAGTPKTLLKEAPERNVNQERSPKRIQRTREVSKKDAIASTRQFCALVNERNRGSIMEVPIETAPDTSGRNAVSHHVPVISPPVTSTTPIVTEAETRGPRTFLPNGSPSRPTATATCIP